ncbi:hypothetical protein [Aporhodopirellula aestuarii]|uniref:DUF4190 domain-containing protein n=1 Tax=Aporhodopirellula aestuarii TaxID=2950107 RepID=A0ABT0U3S2_9BACT|nr:hypothetical protein [Aporhodopirellula aestuarii]MCM2371185.1 hypothetical protein [Aporhodopirellula aestuarii]
MTRARRIELFRPRHAQRLSITDLFAFVTGFGVWFGGMRIAGIYGFVIGCFALQAASGRLLRRNDWQWGAFSGAATMFGSLCLAWVLFGTFGETHPRVAELIEERLRAAEKSLDAYHADHERWPSDLSKIRITRLGRGDLNAYDQELFDYRVDGDRFHLVYSGGDHQSAGVGVSTEVSLDQVNEFQDWRISPVTFLMKSPGAGCMMMALMFSAVVAVGAAMLFCRDSGQTRIDFMAAVLVAIAGSVIGAMLVDLSMIASRW